MQLSFVPGSHCIQNNSLVLALSPSPDHGFKLRETASKDEGFSTQSSVAEAESLLRSHR